MMQDLFHRDAADYRWEMFDPVFDGAMGYAWSLSSFTSTIAQFKGQRVVIDGMSRFIVRDGLIAEYSRIRQRRRGDGAARRRAGADGESVQALDRLARRSGRRRWTIWRGRKARARKPGA